jgi:Flp pilus assembly pilin Flp
MASGRLRRGTSNQREEESVFKTVWSYVSDERGVETLEWIVVGALIVAIGIAVYPGTLQTQLTTAINAIGGTLTGLASS